MKKFNSSRCVSAALASVITVSSFGFCAYADTESPVTDILPVGTVYIPESDVTDAPDDTTEYIETTVPETTVPEGFWLTQDTTTADENFKIRDDFPLTGTYNLKITMILPDGVDELECKIYDCTNDKCIIEYNFTRNDDTLLLENLPYDFEGMGGNFNKYQYMIWAKDETDYLFKPNSFPSMLDGFKLEHFAENDNLSQTVMPVQSYKYLETTTARETDKSETAVSYETTLPYYDTTGTTAVSYDTTLPYYDTTGTTTAVHTTTTTEEASASAVPSEIPSENIFRGDVTTDGSIDVRDVASLARYLVNLTEYNEQQLLNADTTNDGIVNVNDITHLKRYLIGDIENI